MYESQNNFIKYTFFKLLIIFLFFNINNFFKFFNNIKVCLCTVGKNENKYVREYIEHYNKLGVDKLYIYDNNDINEESFYSVISDYVKSNYVKIMNYRGMNKIQKSSMNDCYKKYNQKYDWLIFYDMDEFLYLKNYTNIKTFLKEPKFDKCKLIRLNLVYQTDNNQLYYKNKTLLKRFPKINFNIKNSSYRVKTIIRGNIKGLKIIQVHYLLKMKGCNGFGNIVDKQIDSIPDIVDLNYYYIKHYAFKSTEEFINKIKRGDAVCGLTKKNMLHKIDVYFKYNTINLRKIYFIQNKTGLNLNSYLKKLNKNKEKKELNIKKNK